jgi:hypothetical protein
VPAGIALHYVDELVDDDAEVVEMPDDTLSVIVIVAPLVKAGTFKPFLITSRISAGTARSSARSRAVICGSQTPRLSIAVTGNQRAAWVRQSVAFLFKPVGK